MGCVMGDGNINTAQKNPKLYVDNTNIPFLEWIDTELKEISLGVDCYQTGKEAERKAKELGKYEVNSGQRSDMYRLRTIAHPQIQEFEEWHSSGEKIFPEDIELTPLLAKIWYCCDGGISWGNSPYVGISIHNELERKENIINSFENIGFSPKVSGPNLHFTKEESREFLEWLGQPLPGMEYKWEFDDSEEYFSLRNE